MHSFPRCKQKRLGIIDPFPASSVRPPAGSYDGKTLTIAKPFVATLANVSFDKPAQATVAGSRAGHAESLDGQLTLEPMRPEPTLR